MHYSIHLSKNAEDDLFNSYAWYESKQPELGEQFLECIDKALKAICFNPTAFQVQFKKNVRGYVVARFPYLLLYIIEKKEINVIAVFNTNRNPVIWKKRL